MWPFQPQSSASTQAQPLLWSIAQDVPRQARALSQGTNDYLGDEEVGVRLGLDPERNNGEGGGGPSPQAQELAFLSTCTPSPAL